MKHQIKHRYTESVLFECDLPDDTPSGLVTRHVLEKAIAAAANLARANLAGANLAAANLDGANLARANLAGANLDGANLARGLIGGRTSHFPNWPHWVTLRVFHRISDNRRRETAGGLFFLAPWTNSPRNCPKNTGTTFTRRNTAPRLT